MPHDHNPQAAPRRNLLNRPVRIVKAAPRRHQVVAWLREVGSGDRSRTSAGGAIIPGKFPPSELRFQKAESRRWEIGQISRVFSTTDN
jgi:hypothetical protein